jgi:hypothetical protein
MGKKHGGEKDDQGKDTDKGKKGGKTHEHGRTLWLDDSTDTPLVPQYAQRLGGFLEAMADGKIEKKELKDQESRVVELMKKIEPALDDKLHADITQLLCELTAYNIMHTIHELVEQKPKTEFKG